MLKSVLSTSDASISPTPAVATFNSYLPLHVCDIPISANLLCQARKMSPPAALFLQIFTTTSIFYAFMKNILYVHQQSIFIQRKPASCNYNFVSLCMLIKLLFDIILTFHSTKMISAFNIFRAFLFKLKSIYTKFYTNVTSTSNHMFRIAILDKLPECIFENFEILK